MPRSEDLPNRASCHRRLSVALMKPRTFQHRRQRSRAEAAGFTIRTELEPVPLLWPGLRSSGWRTCALTPRMSAPAPPQHPRVGLLMQPFRGCRRRWSNSMTGRGGETARSVEAVGELGHRHHLWKNGELRLVVVGLRASIALRSSQLATENVQREAQPRRPGTSCRGCARRAAVAFGLKAAARVTLQRGF